MYNTQGLLEACIKRFAAIEGKPILINNNPERVIEINQRFIAYFGVGIDTCKESDEEANNTLFKYNHYKKLTEAKRKKYLSMTVEEFADEIYDIATVKGEGINAAWNKVYLNCLYAAYIYVQVTEFIEKQNATFTPVPFNKAMQAMGFINTGIITVDPYTKNIKARVGDVEIIPSASKTSTGALMLMDYLLKEAYRTHSPSLCIPIKEYAEIKKRSTSKQSLQKLKLEVVSYLRELKNLKYSVRERIDGKIRYVGQMDINGGNTLILNGCIYWNFNQDLFESLMKNAPTDYPVELWSADPRTSTYYFGRYIANNWRMNEGKPGRNKIPIRTLIEKSPNLPKYEDVMNGNRNVSDRIIKKTFKDLDALETLYYDFYTEAGERIEDPSNLDYRTFEDGYILVDYSDYPQHSKRIYKRQERQKKIQDAKEKAAIKAAVKEAENRK